MSLTGTSYPRGVSRVESDIVSAPHKLGTRLLHPHRPLCLGGFLFLSFLTVGVLLFSAGVSAQVRPSNQSNVLWKIETIVGPRMKWIARVPCDWTLEEVKDFDDDDDRGGTLAWTARGRMVGSALWSENCPWDLYERIVQGFHCATQVQHVQYRSTALQRRCYGGTLVHFFHRTQVVPWQPPGTESITTMFMGYRSRGGLRITVTDERLNIEDRELMADYIRIFVSPDHLQRNAKR